MAKRPAPGEPYVGMKVALGGEITRLEEGENCGFIRVTVELPIYAYPLTFVWSPPDGERIIHLSSP